MRYRRGAPGLSSSGTTRLDDFIVRATLGGVFTVPTVPCALERLEPFALPAEGAALRRDTRYAGKVKWYMQPIVFGGDPAPGDDILWVDHDQHAGLVRWWNDRYRSLHPKPGGA